MYAADLASGRVVWTAMTTTVQNESAPLTNTPVHFCPGMQGGNEWNGAAYSPLTKMVYNGAVDWCATVAPAVGKAEPKGTMDAPATGTGWITAVDAATGKGAWKFHTPSPVLAAVTPTAGGVLFAGDLAGNFYVFNAATGAIEWKTDVGGSLAGGVVSYASTTGAQRVAVAAGMKSNVWPMAKGGAQIVVYGLK